MTIQQVEKPRQGEFQENTPGEKGSKWQYESQEDTTVQDFNLKCQVDEESMLKKERKKYKAQMESNK